MPFVKGQSGNPTGRKPETMGRKNMKKIMNNEIDRIAKYSFGMTLVELKEVLKDADQLTAAAQLLLSQIKKGNLKALELLMDRVLGRCMQQTQVEVSSDKGVTFTLVKESENRKEDEAD